MDWSRFLDEDGKQLQTVGHHFSGSRPLNKDELVMLDRRGVCLSCHATVPDNDVAINLLSHVAKYSGTTIDNDKHRSILKKSVRIAAWVQVLIGIALIVLIVWLLRRRKKRARA